MNIWLHNMIHEHVNTLTPQLVLNYILASNRYVKERLGLSATRYLEIS